MNGRASSSWEANRKIWKLLPAVFMIDNHVGVPVHCNICIYGLATGKTILYNERLCGTEFSPFSNFES